MTGGVGDVVNVPRGTVHRFQNTGTAPARLILTFTPAGIERFFEETLERALEPGQIVLDNIDEVAARYVAAAPATGSSSSTDSAATPPAGGCSKPVPRRLVISAVLAAAALASLAGPAAARQSLIAYEGEASARGIVYLRDPSGGRPIRVHTTGTPGAPALSPLGRRIAFASGGRIWTVYVDGTVLHQVTAGTPRAHAPSWAPTGTALAYSGGPRGARHIYSVTADGSVAAQLTFARASDEDPAWSARNRIAFVRRGDIFTIAAAPGGTAQRLTRGKSEDGEPAWSPDGRWIAFTRAGRSHRDVYVKPVDGGRTRRLTYSEHGAVSPTWSPDGRSIAFALRDARGRRSVYVFGSDGRGLRRVGSSTANPRALDWRATGFDPVIAAAGDISCDPASASFNGGLGTGKRCAQMTVSNALLRMDLSAVLALGDIQYEDGRLSKFVESFDPTWGRLKPLIRPVPGNHEYRTPGAGGYFDYFDGDRNDGPAGVRGLGYYSFDIGRWHVVALNSECANGAPGTGAPACAVGSPQERWLRADLAAHPRACTLAFFHHPLLASGLRMRNDAIMPLWRALADGGADVALVGHDHAYERFAPIDATGALDRTRGLREFVVGTGGKSLRRARWHAPNTQFRQNRAPGLLELTLHPTGYGWRFVSAVTGAALDAGSSACH